MRPENSNLSPKTHLIFSSGKNPIDHHMMSGEWLKGDRQEMEQGGSGSLLDTEQMLMLLSSTSGRF